MNEQLNNNEAFPPRPVHTPFPGSLTPGWNDPPPIAANAPGRQRLDLRKRVAYPIQNGLQLSNEYHIPPSAMQPMPAPLDTMGDGMKIP